MIEMHEIMSGIEKMNTGELFSLSQQENTWASTEISNTFKPKQVFLYAELDCRTPCHPALLFMKYLWKFKEQRNKLMKEKFPAGYCSKSPQMSQITGTFTRKISVRARPVHIYSQGIWFLGHCGRLYRTKWNFNSMALLRMSII